MSYSYTENGAIQYENSGNAIVDFFSNAAALRGQLIQNDFEALRTLFINSFNKAPHITVMLGLGWLGDPRHGAGEKAARRYLQTLMADVNPEFIIDNLYNIEEYGSWKDLIHLYYATDNKYVKAAILHNFCEAIRLNHRLAAKWAPRLKSKYHSMALAMRDNLGLTNKEYRTLLKNVSETVEQQMCAGDWENIDFSKVPSVAGKKYVQSFIRHQSERFTEFMLNKDTKVNASVLYPHDILSKLLINGISYSVGGGLNESEMAYLEKAWANLPDYLSEDENILTLVDISSSMYKTSLDSSGTKPVHVAISLGIYLANRAKGSFHNKLMMFAEEPAFVHLTQGASLKENIQQIIEQQVGFSTNFEKAYKRILEAAILMSTPKKDMPTMLLVPSDMQFDPNKWNMPAFDAIQAEYTKAGYDAPKLVFWNLDKRNLNGSPAQANDTGVALVSGFSPSILTAVLNAQEFSPLDIALEKAAEYDNFDHTNLDTHVEFK
ncbi:DUF2828 family protein [Acinetobacter sp.]|uniref:DUF2828 family protein n=1 Tax=Acinetobacter sp. TaxID=472 RepID=UPI003D0301D4